MFAVTSSFILHQLCLLGGLNLYVQAHNPCLSSLQLLWKQEKQTNEQTNNKQTNKNKTICAITAFFTTWMLFNVRDQTVIKPRVWSFFFSSSETFSLVLMQKTCLYFCYAVTMRSFSNRGSRDQSSSGFHTQFLLIIIHLLILSPYLSTGNCRTYQLFLL